MVIPLLLNKRCHILIKILNHSLNLCNYDLTMKEFRKYGGYAYMYQIADKLRKDGLINIVASNNGKIKYIRLTETGYLIAWKLRSINEIINKK